MSTYPGSLDNGATDTEYTPLPDRRVSAQQQQFDAINEAIGKLEYNLEQHIAQCADGLAPLADFISASWAVLDEYEARLAKLEAARPTMDSDGVLVSHDAWDALERELEALRAFKAFVPWNSLRELSGWPCERPYLIADEWIGKNAPNTSSGYIYITVEQDKYRREQAELAALRAEVLRLNAQYYEMETYGCPYCNSDGEINGNTCFACNGHGVLYVKPVEAAE